ncbi:hypothetical protein GCM10022384_04510 [Streptomyces marokkonensis]|uniref:Uncharacterized protein n=1 Tax=Streptomyces marokkonensis TaxID=324855 RepID=A0ABP7NU71_9ACTN
MFAVGSMGQADMQCFGQEARSWERRDAATDASVRAGRPPTVTARTQGRVVAPVTPVPRTGGSTSPGAGRTGRTDRAADRPRRHDPALRGSCDAPCRSTPA